MRPSYRILFFAAVILSLIAAPVDAQPIGIVAFGDSLTAGYLIPHAHAYPAQLQAVLRRKGYDVAVKNAGLDGDTTQGALRRFDQAIDPGTAICIVEFGINDLRLGSPMDAVRTRMASLIRALKARHIAVLVVGAGGVDFAGVARENGVPYAPWIIPPHKFRASDGAHYSAEGYKIAVGQMLPQVEALIAHLPAR
jgi:acyl-CoA thioesterase-1